MIIILTPVHVETEFFNNVVASFNVFQSCITELIVENSVNISDIFQVAFEIFKYICHVNIFI